MYTALRLSISSRVIDFIGSGKYDFAISLILVFNFARLPFTWCASASSARWHGKVLQLPLSCAFSGYSRHRGVRHGPFSIPISISTLFPMRRVIFFLGLPPLLFLWPRFARLFLQLPTQSSLLSLYLVKEEQAVPQRRNTQPPSLSAPTMIWTNVPWGTWSSFRSFPPRFPPSIRGRVKNQIYCLPYFIDLFMFYRDRHSYVVESGALDIRKNTSEHFTTYHHSSSLLGLVLFLSSFFQYWKMLYYKIHGGLE